MAIQAGCELAEAEVSQRTQEHPHSFQSEGKG
jgi:hypothetical protein